MTAGWTIVRAERQRNEELNYEMLAVADAVDGSGHVLMVQRSLETDAQDRALGMDTYCLVDERQRTFYGGVKSWRLDARLLRLELTPEAADTFGCEAFVLPLGGDISEEMVASELGRLLANG